jgi:hypothetical protein
LSAQPEKRQDRHDDDHKTDEIDDLIHCLARKIWSIGGTTRVSLHRSGIFGFGFSAQSPARLDHLPITQGLADSNLDARGCASCNRQGNFRHCHVFTPEAFSQRGGLRGVPSASEA